MLPGVYQLALTYITRVCTVHCTDLSEQGVVGNRTFRLRRLIRIALVIYIYGVSNVPILVPWKVSFPNIRLCECGNRWNI